MKSRQVVIVETLDPMEQVWPSGSTSSFSVEVAGRERWLTVVLSRSLVNSLREHEGRGRFELYRRPDDPHGEGFSDGLLCIASGWAYRHGGSAYVRPERPLVGELVSAEELTGLAEFLGRNLARTTTRDVRYGP